MNHLRKTVLLCLALLALIGCGNPIESGNPAPIGEGAVQLCINVGTAQEGEVLPDERDDFTYNLTFTADNKKPVTKTLYGQIGQITLEIGTWSLAVAAKHGNNPVGSGSFSPVLVEENKTTSVTVFIAPLTDGAAGTFAWLLNFNTTLVGSATLTVSERDGTPSQQRDVTNERSGTLSLASGSWLVRAELASADDPSMKAAYSEIVHIYPGLSSSVTWTFSDADFVATRQVGVSVTINTGSKTAINGVTLMSPGNNAHNTPMTKSGGMWTQTVSVSGEDTGINVYLNIHTANNTITTAPESLTFANNAAALAEKTVYAVYGTIANGSVSINSAAKSGTFQVDVLSGTDITVSATPNAGYAFKTLMGVANAVWNGTVTANTEITAVFEFEVSIDNLAGSPKPQTSWGTLITYSYIPQNISNTFTGDPATTRTITWQSRTSTGVLIIDDASHGGTSHTATLTSSGGGWYYHRVDLTGLEPGETYRFIVGSPSAYSPVYSFTTPVINAGSSFFVIHVTDPQIGDNSTTVDAAVWKRVLEKAVAMYPQAAFIVNTGDLVNNNREQDLPYYFDCVQETLASYAFFYSMGNNDNDAWYNKYFFTPANNMDNGFLYSFDYGNVHFVNVNQSTGNAGTALSTARRNWLRDDLQGTAKQWKVALTHQPDYGRSGNNTNVAQQFDNNNVALVMAGHNHFYARSKPINAAGNNKTNGTVYCIPNTAGGKFNTTAGESFLAMDRQPNLPMFSVYEFTATNIHLQAYTVNASGTATLYDSYSWR